MKNIYTNGKYLEVTQTWHTEDSPWKADYISRIIRNNQLRPNSIAEIGCGAGAVLNELSKKDYLKNAQFSGYDISPQAIEIAQKIDNKNVNFICEDILLEDNKEYFDILLVIDVFEHVQDYIGFVKKCREKAAHKIYHIPLDIHVSSVLRNTFNKSRYPFGHLHYFTMDTAIATLRDTGHEILDFVYINDATGLFSHDPSFKKAVANIPRWLFSKLSLPMPARIFGGYSLLVLAR